MLKYLVGLNKAKGIYKSKRIRINRRDAIYQNYISEMKEVDMK